MNILKKMTVFAFIISTLSACDSDGGSRTISVAEEEKTSEEKTNPEEKEKTDPEEKEKTDPEEKEKTDPEEKEKTDPEEKEKTDPEEKEKTDPEEKEKKEPVVISTYTAASEFGSSDASGAVALDSNYMIVADDEANVLRVYPRSTTESTQAINAVNEWDYSVLTGLTKELDVEALTWYQPGKLLVIGSHSNKQDGGEAVADRGHLFAVNVKGTGSETTFEYINKYSGLEQDLISWDNNNIHGKGVGYFGFNRSAAAGSVPESVSGFSIEGATINGDTLLLGFRAPQMDQRARNKALILPVTNYMDLINGTASTAQFGEPFELNLGGRGVRDIIRWDDYYLIVSGPSGISTTEVKQNFVLFKWYGGTDQPIMLDNDLEQLRAINKGSIESIVQPVSKEDNLQFLLDNGDTIWPGRTAISKDLPANEQQFQGAYMQVGQQLEDQQAPNLVKQFPADGFVGVNTDTRIELIFDEGVTLGKGKLAIYQGNQLFSSYNNESSEVSVVFNRLVIRPTTKLENSKSYSLRIEDTLVKDSAGNDFNGKELGTFVTAGEPTKLEVGDIQFVAANAEAPDAIAFMLMKDINGGTEINFTDRDYYDVKNAFWDRKKAKPALNEGVFKWTADRNLKAGDIVTIQTDTALSPIADVGQVIGSPSGLGKEETIYAMQSTVVEGLADGFSGEIKEPGKFLAAITLGGQSGSDIPSDLTGKNLIFIPQSGPADQTNAIFDVEKCGRDPIDVQANIYNQGCWKVTFKSEGATGFPLFDNNSLFAIPFK
ncbi:DUF3616 domain-containing protein [Serratia sp. DD3]|uniref:DUF3616 domain-containing protein n=1 Tax=Serratia sp. DD3 TaxID=1410619 RepID=UPI0004DA730F|nr:DUF3616 domain-containing protein [Serratia sp. DD3]KEY58840.1 hypothetical protein SRDD_22300 [Serratia sp. DD3]